MGPTSFKLANSGAQDGSSFFPPGVIVKTVIPVSRLLESAVTPDKTVIWQPSGCHSFEPDWPPVPRRLFDRRLWELAKAITPTAPIAARTTDDGSGTNA